MAEPPWKREWHAWLRGSGDPATMVLGPVTATAGLKAAPLRGQLRGLDAPRVIVVGGAALLCLPGGLTGKWLPHPGGGVLVRGPTAALLPATHKGLVAAEKALTTIAAWTPLVDAWPIAGAGYAMCADRADGEFWSLPAAIPDGTYAIIYADATVGRFAVQCLVFARAGTTPATVLADVRAALGGGPAVDASVRQASRAEVAQAKKLRWLTPAETSVLLIDHAASQAWLGVFDARGRSAIARGEPNDYERIVGQTWVAVGAGKAAAQALVLDGPAPTTWLASPDGGAVVRHLNGDQLVASALGAAERLGRGGRAGWTAAPGTLVVGADGARLLDAAARGARPRKRDVLELALAPGRYQLERGEADGAVGVGGEAQEYRVELWRLRPR
ncbi:MAG: hypothetical protein IPL61_08765 [Myxococcales bacterium]|nr:hypothetical protein [Myxococcales bacterium]